VYLLLPHRHGELTPPVAGCTGLEIETAHLGLKEPPTYRAEDNS
jgi:hypothetical protein